MTTFSAQSTPVPSLCTRDGSRQQQRRFSHPLILYLSTKRLTDAIWPDRHWNRDAHSYHNPMRPRRLGVSPASSPRSSARRQVLAPISPASRVASASRRMPRLYSAGNCRRFAFAGTSGSATHERPSERPRAGETALALRALCVSLALPACCSSILSICSIVVSIALYTNFREGRCLSYIGREGAAKCQQIKRTESTRRHVQHLIGTLRI